MAISGTLRLALKALSYGEADITKSYKIERAVKENIKSSRLLKPLYKTWNHSIKCGDHEVSVRLYTPSEQIRKPRMLLFFHGGGWVTESVDTYNNVCMYLAEKTKSRVASVEYRLAPENPFPNGLEDCYNAAREILLNPHLLEIHADELVLVGDSAGGNLAAAVSLMARDRGEFTVSKQILIYPLTNNDHTESSPFMSVHENGTDYLLTSKRICEYLSLYAAKPEDYRNPYFAPLLSEDLSNQPDTLIITAEYDPLRDEGEEYGKALIKAGNTAKVYRVRDALHGFFSLNARFKPVRNAYKLINTFLYGTGEI